jgi:hypothetical protein
LRVYGRERVHVRQLVIPDTQDRLPWEAHYAHLELFTAQRSWAAQSRSGPLGRRRPRRPGRLETTGDPHLGVLTARYGFEGGLPALLVVHDEEGAWQILDGVHEPDADTATLACSRHVVVADPSLDEVLRSKPAGLEADREGRWGPGGLSRMTTMSDL